MEKKFIQVYPKLKKRATIGAGKIFLLTYPKGESEILDSMGKTKHNVTINRIPPMQNRTFKDSVFTGVFYSDEDAKDNLLSLYNALSGNSYTDSSVIRQVRLEDVLFKNMKNDIAFTVNDEIIVLGEHQSTKNLNMPLRMLLYIAREYEKLTEVEDRYKESRIKIPTPVFYVFYNGLEDAPVEEIQKLSDSFKTKSIKDEIPIEVIVHVININTDKGHEILSKCKVLREYSLFVDTVRKYPHDASGFTAAINECIRKGILKEFLERNGSEVINMLLAEYDYDTDMAVKKQEGYDKGYKNGYDTGLSKIQTLIAKTNALGKSIDLGKIATASPAEIDEMCRQYGI